MIIYRKPCFFFLFFFSWNGAKVATTMEGEYTGLDVDYLRSFGSVLDIIPLADFITKLSPRCEIYGKRALLTSDETRIKLPVGADV